MDWYSWLSKTKLDPSLVHEYSLVFSNNELEEDDIYYLNHEFLQSMGIPIAKHRLEILKLAKRNSNFRFPIYRLTFAIKRTKGTLVKYVRTLLQGDKKAFLLRSKQSSSSRSSGVILKSKSMKKTPNMGNQEKLLLTNGNSFLGITGSTVNSFSRPMVYDISNYNTMDGYDDPHLSARVEEIKWDTMFQDLKPT